MKRALLIAAAAAAMVGLSSTPAQAQLAIGVQLDAPWGQQAPPPPPPHYGYQPQYQPQYQPSYQPDYQQDYQQQAYDPAPPAPPPAAWVEGYRQWNGYQYVWYPGHWDHLGNWDRHHHHDRDRDGRW